MQTTLSELMNAKQDEYRYLLLDPLKNVTSWNTLHLDRLNEKWGSDLIHRVLRPDLAYAPQYCPILLLLAPPGVGCDDELLLESEEYSRAERLYEKRYVCGWISSPLAPEALATRLAHLCHQVKRGGLIPFYEPLRLELLQTLNEEKALSSLLSPVSQWCWLSCSGHLLIQSNRSGGDEWRMKWGAERAQNNVRDIWRLLFAWQRIGSLPPDAARQAADAWAKSAEAKLHHTADRICLALSSLIFSTNATEQADVQALLRQVASNPDLYLTQLLPTLPDTVWQTSDQP